MTDTAKKMVFDEEARALLLKGLKKLAEVVGPTLGPKGLYVALEKKWGSPNVTNDGNSIVHEIEVADAFEQMGVSMGKEVAKRAKDSGGDGTTTATILLHALVEGALKRITAGASPIGVKRGMEKAVDVVLEAISEMAKPIKDNRDILNVATVSASGNKEIGSLIAEAVSKVGSALRVAIEDSKGIQTKIEVVEGMQVDRGYLSPYFCTNSERMVAEMSHPLILLSEKKISNIHEILAILQNVAMAGKELLLVADDIDADVLSTLVVNKLRGTLKLVAIKAPGFGDRRKALLQDLAALTGGVVVSDDTGTDFKDITEADLGSAEKVVVTKDNTTFFKGKGSEEDVQARIRLIDAELERNPSSYDKEKLEERRASLSGGIAEIQVGAPTETELHQKKQIFTDSLNSTRSAMEEGIVPGGGVAFLHAAEKLKNLQLKGDEALGVHVVQAALGTPLKLLAQNSAFDPAVVSREVMNKGGNFGFNALTGKVEDLLEAGVVDSARVLKTSFLLAAREAGVIILSEVLIADEDEEALD